MAPGGCKTRWHPAASARSVAGWRSICIGSSFVIVICGSSTRVDDGG